MDLYEYDRIQDIMTLNKEKHDTAYKININPYIIMDVSNDNLICGITISNASKVLHLTRDQINKSKVECIIDNDHNEIVFSLKILNNKKIIKELKINREFNTALIGTEFYFK